MLHNNSYLTKNEAALNKLSDIASKAYHIPSELYSQYSVKRGLRNDDGSGVVVGLTNIGEVHGYIVDEGEKKPVFGKLRYRGMDVEEIIESCTRENRFGFEETIYLLLFGELPTDEELVYFTNLLDELRTLPDNFTEDMIMKAPSSDIMNKLARSVLVLYSYDPHPDETDLVNILRQSIELIARMPTLTAYGYQAKAHYYGGQSLYIHSPQKNLSTAENFLHMLRKDNKYTDQEAKILDTMLILHAEHGGGNNSAFATRVVSSSLTDTYSAISAGISSLKGPLHGGANGKVMGMMDDIMANVKVWSDKSEVEDYISKILKKEAYDKKGLVYGIGHAVYTKSDPRAVILKEQARELADAKGMREEFELYSLIEDVTPKLFKKIKNDNKVIAANVDFYSGFVYKMLGIPKELYTPLFAISRTAGWCAHRIEEVVCGARIIRPAYKSISKRRKYIDLDRRK